MEVRQVRRPYAASTTPGRSRRKNKKQATNEKMRDMKKIFLSMIPLMALVSGCVRGGDTVAADESGTLTVAFDIPEARLTRAYTSINGETISSLWVMVFNEAGNYVSRHQGAPRSGNDWSQCRFHSIPISDNARTLHFVANYDWSGFSDVDWLGLSESEVMLAMSVGTAGRGNPSPVAFWQRAGLPGGIVGDPGSTVTLPGTVHLLRNVARVTVENSTTTPNLTDVQFAVGNRFDKGSVAPYNTETFLFGVGNDPADAFADDDFVTEAAGTSVAIVEANDFVYASGGSVDLYERKNSTAHDYAFVIVKAKYNGRAAWSYYKIDIVEQDASVLLDIRRNWRYHIRINSVFNAGYDNLADAVNNLASNNVNASVVAMEYTDISNGTNVLHVDQTDVTFVSTNTPFEIGYFFKSGGVVDNTGVTVTLNQTAGRQVVGGTVTATDGIIGGVTASVLPQDDIYRGTITISKGGLSRTIRLQLRPRMKFVDVGTTPTNGIIPNSTGQQAQVHFKFPDDISQSLFPIRVRVYTRKFTPAPGQGLSVEVGGGDYWYVYNAPFLGIGAEHTITLLSNSADTDETVRLENDLFDANGTDADFYNQ